MNVFQDFRYGLRLLLKRPVFTAVAVASLALGIGANSAIFSVVNTVLLRSLPFQDPDRLVMIWETPPNRPEDFNGATVSNYLAWKEQSQVFDTMGAVQFGWPVNLSSENTPERAQGQRFSATFFPTLGVQPVLGRWFLPEEDRVGAPLVVVIGHRLWQRRFAGDPGVIGKTLRIDGQETSIVGVMPPGFTFFVEEADLWMPFRFANFNIQSRSRYLGVMARLKPGVSLQQAQTEMAGLAGRLALSNPEMNKGWSVKVQPVHQAFLGGLRTPLLVLLGAVGFVLLIACANVANLLLAQAAARQREIAIRTAIGAGRWRLLRQFLAESLLLSLAGAALGLGLAYGGLKLVIMIHPGYMPRLQEAGLDARVLGFTLLIAMGTALLFGLLPAWLIARSPHLREAASQRHSGAASGPLVAVQVALAVVLLIGAGLMIHSFAKLHGIDPGFRTRNLLTFQIRLARQQYAEDVGASGGFHIVRLSPRIGEFHNQVWRRLQAVTGVESAAAITYAPLGGGVGGFVFTIEGRPRSDSEKESLQAGYHPVTPNLFRTLGVPLLRGRDFTEKDGVEAPWVVIINQALARRYWPKEDPLGQRIRIQPFPDERPREIVGVVGDIRHGWIAREPEPQMYVAHLQQPLVYQARLSEPRLQMTYLMRTTTPLTLLTPALRRAVAEVDPNQPLFALRTMDQYLAEQVREPRFYMLLLGIFAGVALALAAVGIYGVMAYSVAQRTHEIGIRMALGATAIHVLRLVLRQGMLLVLAGAAAGIAGAYALTRVLGSQLYGVTAGDPATFAGVSAVLLAVALLACYLPARRATRVDPTVALRHE